VQRTTLSTGGKIGIGLGVPIAVFTILFALWAGFYFGKRRAPGHTRATSDGFQEKPELPSEILEGLRVKSQYKYSRARVILRVDRTVRMNAALMYPHLLYMSSGCRFVRSSRSLS
jgi:hypothetical protein